MTERFSDLVYLKQYRVMAEDTAPIVIGGVGGSGTRLVASLLPGFGVELPGLMNDALDNMWFSLLFVRRSILLKPRAEISALCWMFSRLMRHNEAVPAELLSMLSEAAEFDRGPALNKAMLNEALESILSLLPSESEKDLSLETPWGWKQPNSHVMLPMLNQYFPNMKYIYVARNGLDMAFSANQNQLRYFWGDLLLEGDFSVTPRNSLRYWVAAFKRVLGDKALLGDRLHILNFDALCDQPASELARLKQFLELDVDSGVLSSLADSIVKPASRGRHAKQDCSQFDSADIDFVRAAGFDVQV
ncbi:sulfotransferase [Parahaliea sp. F7430]|uniref:Sulfotransferase n=2 Tax=Sediminihaliea albiluteola TaxID=2758564 RepID=A0A7W2TYH2_9GAMM|nr:sulfotransferase [Sediminihaliea albiluteola]